MPWQLRDVDPRSIGVCACAIVALNRATPSAFAYPLCMGHASPSSVGVERLVAVKQNVPLLMRDLQRVE
jgi:hypothetical protein